MHWSFRLLGADCLGLCNGMLWGFTGKRTLWDMEPAFPETTWLRPSCCPAVHRERAECTRAPPAEAGAELGPAQGQSVVEERWGQDVGNLGACCLGVTQTLTVGISEGSGGQRSLEGACLASSLSWHWPGAFFLPGAGPQGSFGAAELGLGELQDESLY